MPARPVRSGSSRPPNCFLSNRARELADELILAVLLLAEHPLGGIILMTITITVAVEGRKCYDTGFLATGGGVRCINKRVSHCAFPRRIATRAQRLAQRMGVP